MIRKQKGVVLAGVFGNALEWYDFSVYAFFVPVLATLFFPAKDPFVSLLQTFGVFAVGFLIRPVGAILFGYLGDHLGRRKALIISIIMISVPTFCLGLLPDYHAIGVLAPLALIFLRLIQGMAVSGELTTATSFLIEHAAPHQRGFAGSLAMCSALIGIVASSAVATFVTELVTDTQLYVWGWRIPFLVGGVLGIVGLVIRLRTVDPTLYQTVHDKQKRESLPSVWMHLLTLNYQIVLSAILLTSVMAICNYFLIAYFNTFFVKTLGLPLRTAMAINLLGLCVLTVLMPLMAMLSDKIGRKWVLGGGIVGFIFLAHPIFGLMAQQTVWTVLAGELLFVLVLAPISGLIPTTLAELFDTYHRNTGLSLSYNLSLALFGGTAPLVAVILVESTGSLFAPAWYIIVAAIIGLIALLFLEESYKKALR